MKSYFSKHYSTMKYSKNSESKNGLRNAQIGAIHAISSFFTLNKNQAAIIVMPTGSGKTSVLMMSPYVLESKKVLVITPSVLVRGQIAEEFSGLTTLCKANVFEKSVAKPNVFELKNKYSDELYDSVISADIVVATPICALSLSRTEEINKLFDLVLVDEAHHSPAATWEEVLVNMGRAKHILFTATPFRLDKKEIRGDIVYSYPLSLAYRDGIFGEIQYIPAEVSDDKDIAIAELAEKVFLSDKENELSHYIMVRTNSKKHVEELLRLYSEKTQLRLKKIDSSMTNLRVKRVIEELKSGFLDGIVCVDMLGEGFDFPNLKIAAIHSPHKSLSNTLQFIGRFARTNASNIGIAKFIAMNDEELVIENNKLYSADSVWQDMIIDMSENKSRAEEVIKRYFKEYEITNKVISNLADDFSLHNLNPNCHAKVYEVSDFNLFAEFPAISKTVEITLVNKNDNTVIVIGKEHISPKWSCSEDLYDVNYLLFIVHFQKSTNLLFIYSQLKSEFVYEQIVEAYCSAYLKVPKSEIHHVLGELNSFEIFNSGMLNRYSRSGETYRIMAGSDVSKAIDPTTGKMFSPGHVFCKAQGTDNIITIGYSSGSKIWSSAYMRIPEYIKWCDYNGEKIVNQKIVVKTNTNYDLLPVAKLLDQYPDNIFMWDFSVDTYITPPAILRQENQYKSTLLDTDIKIQSLSPTEILLLVSTGSIKEKITCDNNGFYSSDTNLITLKDGRREISLSDYFNKSPLGFRTSDDSLIIGNEVNIGDPTSIVFDQNNVIGIKWEEYNTDIKKEISGNNSIQSTLGKILCKNKNFSYIIYDHSSGEMADFITVEETPTFIEVSFYHVKGMSAANYNSSVSDVYEVAGQAVKSLIWLKNKQTLINKMWQRQQSGKCKFQIGKYTDFLATMKQHKPLVGKIVVVQPAISQTVAMPEKIQEVLGASRYYIMNSGSVASFDIWGSE